MSEITLRVDASTRFEASAVGLSQGNMQNIRSTARLSAFFTSEDLEELLSQQGSSSIRFYPGLDGNGQLSLLAVATNIRGDDMVSGDTSKCFVAEGQGRAARLTEQQGVALLTEVGQRIDASAPFFTESGAEGARYSKVSFRRSDIENLLAGGAAGIRFFSTQIIFGEGNNSFNTLAAVAVHASGREGDTGVMSTLPCPPDCPGGGGYINRSSSLSNS